MLVPGVTKHIYEADIREIQTQWCQQIVSLKALLPKDYNEETIVELLKRYYPHEWKSVEYKFSYYSKKDKAIIKWKGKARYRMPEPVKLLRRNAKFRRVLSESFREGHREKFDENVRKQNENALMEKRRPKIERIGLKIAKAKSKTQQVTPEFIDKLIGFYERKRTSQKDRMYILRELMKYYNDKVINFFFKLNDTEINRQLRENAFYHLQSFNYSPRLRKQKYMTVHTCNKKRKEYLKNVYARETYSIPQNPQELEYRIHNGMEQSVKTYDYFICHSSIDSNAVQKLIDYENHNGKNVFCDWISDSDYLKRKLLCEATLRVIEWRLRQSDAVIFVCSKDSLKSKWCNYELNYFWRLQKPIYTIMLESIIDDSFAMELIDARTFYKEDYDIDLI